MKNTFLLLLLLSTLFLACDKNDDNTATEFIAQETYALPGDTLYPEGIAYKTGAAIFYTGSVTTGDVLSVNVQSGTVSTFSAGTAAGRKAATGLKLDNNDRLWVCGGADTKIQVLSASGTLLKSWDAKALFNAGFINDCIIDTGHVYFTDSRVQKIYRTPVKGDPGNLEEWLTFTDAQIPYAATGTNANGIVLTPDNKYLIIVVSSSGKLYRIDKTTKAISEITLNTPVTSGDGMHLEGTTLYISRNATNLIFPVALNAGYTTGIMGTGFGTGLLFNTTIAKAGKYFLTVNGQLNRRGTATPPQLPFSVTRVTIP